MRRVHADLDRVSSSGRQPCIPEIERHRNEQLLSNVDFRRQVRLKATLDSRDLGSVFSDHAHVDLVGVSDLHLVNLEYKGERDPHRGWVFVTPQTRHPAPNYVEEIVAHRREVTEERCADLHERCALGRRGNCDPSLSGRRAGRLIGSLARPLDPQALR